LEFVRKSRLHFNCGRPKNRTAITLEHQLKLMNALTVRGKLAFAFATVLALMTLLGGFSVWQLSKVYAQTDSLLVYRLPGVRDSQRMLIAANSLRSRVYRALLMKPAEVPAAIVLVEKANADFEAARKSYAEFIANPQEKALYESAMVAWKESDAYTQKVIAAHKAGKTDEALGLLISDAGVKRYTDSLEGIGKLATYNDDMAKVDATTAKDTYDGGRVFVAVALLVAIGAAVGLGMVISRAIANPLRDAVKLAEAVAAGDLTSSLSADGKDEVAQLTRALIAMVKKLRDVVTEVRGGVESVGTASAQIATGNADLSQRTEEQASNLQQTAASMEELTVTVKQNADNARAASQLSASASEVAAKGGRVVGEVVTTMDAITASSKRIADIISVIDGIAFQTNILALNAAVEAARAGEQGRGFAVVASEVRSLAQRSAGAAKEIKGLIEQSVEKVDSGAKLVAEAGETMNDIVNQVKRVNDLVAEITSASQEQSTGIAQVGDAVAQLDQVTQQNAALVEESAAAAESMKHQAIKLAETVSIFNVGGQPAMARPAPAAAPAKRAIPAPRKPQAPAGKVNTKSAARAEPATAAVATADAEQDWQSF
jgi:methyl-accepting chemotaxis protein